jgi:hypothetical protein
LQRTDERKGSSDRKEGTYVWLEKELLQSTRFLSLPEDDVNEFCEILGSFIDSSVTHNFKEVGLIVD